MRVEVGDILKAVSLAINTKNITASYLIDPTMTKSASQKNETNQHRSAATREKTCTVQYKAVTAEAPKGVGYLIVKKNSRQETDEYLLSGIS